MINHTLILTIPKVELPTVNILEFAKDLIAANSPTIDYFGVELDNDYDYIDEEMQSKIDNSTYLTFHFSDIEINYVIYDEDQVINLLFNKLNNDEIGQIIVTEKDIEVFINQVL
ncbi:hypothetical protein [Flavobacterium sp. WC2430]|uniref:hypothetical protein n=1 Tax=Flavobacterium sp. WC2430 TaxID=3234137 RepID=UPI00346638F2